MDKEHCDVILTAIADGISVHDRNFTIIYQNPIMQEIFGNRLGEKCHRAYEENETICSGCPVDRCFQDGKIHTGERQIIVNGRQRIFENRAAPLRNDDGQLVAVVEVVRDITVRKEEEERIGRFRDLYAAISHTNKAITQCEDRQDLFEQICRIVVEFGGFSLATIAMLEGESNIRSIAHYGKASHYLDTLIVHADASKAEGQGPTGRAIREGLACICNDFHNNPITTPWREEALKNGIKSSAAFPLKNGGEMVGALKVYAERVGFFDDEIVALLLEMSANISFALDNFRREVDRRAALEALRSSEEQLQLVLEGSSDGFCDWHVDRRIVKMSVHYCRMLGYQLHELAQTPETIKSLVHPADWPRVEAFLNDELINRHPAFEIEVRMQHKSGEWKWIRHRGKVVEWNDKGYAGRVAGTCTDITDKIQYVEELRYANTHDRLTTLFNRSFFDAEIERMRSSRHYPVSIVMADIDGLKLVNDAFGHAAGDHLIRRAADILREAFRREDVVARIGGDEFAIILPSAKEEVVKDAIKRVLVCQAEINKTEEHAVSISLGSATAENADQLNEALRLADTRMYYYKQRRKNSYSSR